jgi:hypothetical protein
MRLYVDDAESAAPSVDDEPLAVGQACAASPVKLHDCPVLTNRSGIGIKHASTRNVYYHHWLADGNANRHVHPLLQMLKNSLMVLCQAMWVFL